MSIDHARHNLQSLLATTSWEEFHHFLISDAMHRLFAHYQEFESRPPSILALCADWKEAATLQQFPFSSITLTGLLPADERMQEYVRKDSRIRYEQQNAECLSLPSRSFDIVFCKEGLHHLARPVIGLYEMMRVCKRAVIFIEGHDGWLNRRLESIGLSSAYESDQAGNIAQRRNYVFRWSPRHLQGVLKSYYLDSGWHVEWVTGWMGNKVRLARQRWVGHVGAFVGWLLSFLPGFEGNYLTVIIYPGTDLPDDPRRLPLLEADA